MHFRPISVASKFLMGLGAIGVLAFVSGCTTVTLSNLTPATVPDNPSEIYTFTLRVVPSGSAVSKASIAPTIVVDGQIYPMKPSPVGEGVYDFEYQVPPGRTDIAYYFLVKYQVESASGGTSPAEAFTGLTHATIVRRYVLAMEVNRGPIGARIGVLGRGFTAQDTISFEGNPARTVFESPTSLSFFVPALQADRNYAVTLSSPAGDSPVGSFRIDGGNVTVDPTSITLSPGGQQALTFTISNPAPAGGLLLDVTTDVPESVIMPEVVVPEGATSVSVTVQAGQPGSGNLFLKGYGAGQVTIPITVAAPSPPSPPSAPETPAK
jgi:hypothetical protein